MEPEVLYSEIEKTKDIVDLAAALLLFCRRHDMTYREADNQESTRMAEASLRLRAESWFKGRFEELDDDNRARVLGALRETSPVPLVVRAHAIAVALDRTLGHLFQGVFRSSGVLRLRPDGPVPVAKPPLREILGSLNARPERLDPRADRLTYLRLAPSDLRHFEIDLDFRFQDHLGPLLDRENQVFATCHPNQSFSELICLNHDTPADSFFWVQPKESGRQDRIARALLESAVAAGARVVVFPELCFAADAAWLKELRSLPEPVRLLVAGSHHIEVDGRRRNQALTLLRGHKAQIRHWKIFRYVDGDLGREDIYEDVPRLTVCFSGGWSLAIVICKDFLVETVREMLSALAVDLVLVPSMTKSATAFEGLVPQLAQTHQAFVVMANSPARESGVHAVFSHPARGAVSSTVRVKGLDAPGLCIHAPGRGWSWIDLSGIID